MTQALLNIGSRSLAATQGSLTTISHNIANVNTEGYTRQQTLLETAGGQLTGAGFFGRGVDLTSVRRQYDQFLTGAVQTTATQAAADAARAEALAELDALFTDAELGVGAAIDGVFSAAGDLANRPTDNAARQTFVSRLDLVARRIASLGAQLGELGTMAEGRMAQDATQVNARLSEIRALNAQIVQAQSSGQPPNDLLDQRDTALQALNGVLSVRTVAAPDGSLSLFTPSGAALLVGSQQATLATAPDPANPDRLGVSLTIGGATQWLDQAALGGGSIAGLMKFRDEDLAATVNQIGRLATVMADAFNTQHARGVDATGAAGGALFTVPGPVTRPHADNTGSGVLAAGVVDASALKASDYGVRWDGSNYTITRLADGQSSTFAALPAALDGLSFSASGTPATGDSWQVRPFAPAASGIAARPVAPQQLATGYAAVAQGAIGNSGGATIGQFQVLRSTADLTLPVTITFNDPPTTFNVTGLAGGDLANVPYSAGQRVPAAPADYNGWSVVLEGAAAAGDRFGVTPTTAPRADNRNALALGRLASLGLMDGMTLNEGYAALIGETGGRVQSARDLASVSGRLQAEVVSRQQAGAGVNLDEEAANLLRYQQAYQACAKIIQASQTLFDALLNATGR